MYILPTSQAAQELREKLREQVKQTEIQEMELAKEKVDKEQIAPEVANDTDGDQPDASPVKENEVPATQEDDSQPYEEEYPDNQQGLWGSREFESPEKTPAETVPGTDSQLPQKDFVSTPVRSQRLPPVASPSHQALHEKSGHAGSFDSNGARDVACQDG